MSELSDEIPTDNQSSMRAKSAVKSRFQESVLTRPKSVAFSKTVSSDLNSRTLSTSFRVQSSRPASILKNIDQAASTAVKFAASSQNTVTSNAYSTIPAPLLTWAQRVVSCKNLTALQTQKLYQSALSLQKIKNEFVTQVIKDVRVNTDKEHALHLLLFVLGEDRAHKTLLCIIRLVN